MSRPKPPGAVRRGGHVVAPPTEGLTLDDIQGRRPSRMTADECEAWTRYAAQLADVRQVSATDLAALELLCYAYADLCASREAVTEHGRTYTETTAGGTQLLKARPEVQMASDAARRMRQLLVELGMTPASRGKVERRPAKDPHAPKDPWDEVGEPPEGEATPDAAA